MSLTKEVYFDNLFSKLKDFSEEERREDPFILLVSTVISQRTKDELTEEIMGRIRGRIRNPWDLVSIPVKELERLIYPSGFYRNKAKNLKEIARVLIESYGGKVPDTLEELLRLKGVGRKTANLVLTLGFKKEGICVDTHVHRISNRLGIVRTKNPKDTEFALREILPRKYWSKINGTFVNFGKKICKPTKPKCGICPLTEECPKIDVR